jgi:uncharacterized protein YyaL (SSP411 family)
MEKRDSMGGVLEAQIRPHERAAAPQGYNRLHHEKSPYLLQHADNPVDWYPWGEEAFARARAEDKPVFLSIGYSTCHWCHVMERESFEDSTVAKLLNETFVCVKVDREERPDVDELYMAVCQMMTGSGGWPLTVILSPERKPFFAGTYFPRETRFGRIGLLDLIPRLQEIWTSRRSEALQSAEQILATLHQSADVAKSDGGSPLSRADLDSAYAILSRSFDERYGGFGEAPKFPAAHNLLFLLRYWHRSGDGHALYMVEKTLESMRQGGIFDHLGFGFHRYSTDDRWLVPHFEKMLYDQAMISLAFAEAYQATRREDFAQTTRQVFQYVIDNMQDPQGGFYSAEDADSEGEEGKFYLWKEEEIRNLLGEREANAFIRAYGIETVGNFADPQNGHNSGDNIPHLRQSPEALAEALGLSVGELEELLEGARRKLLMQREGRVPPNKDDKILTDWNGLMIAALAKGAHILGESKYAQDAARAADFILNQMRRTDGRLLHRYRDGEAAILAYLDDYAFLIWGLLELYEATFDVHFLKTALDLQEDLTEHYWDQESGGFFMSADDGEELLLRRKEFYDGALPSGNSIALLNLVRLARITADERYEQAAAAMVRSFEGTVQRYPAGFTQFLSACDFALGPSWEIVIAGDLQNDDTQRMIGTLRGIYSPNKIVLHRPGKAGFSQISELSPLTQAMNPIDGRATAYVCRDYVCGLPTTSLVEMQKLLKTH